MESIEVTYKLERYDCFNFHGWVIWACSEGMEEVYFSSTSLAEASAVFNDLHPEVL